MKLDKAIQALRKAKESFGLDMTDLIILDDIVRAIKVKKSVTIMEIVDTSSAASPATVHARIKRLCTDNFLRKDSHPGSLRHRVLGLGPTYYQLDEELKRM
jgi:hypothetical protein